MAYTRRDLINRTLRLLDLTAGSPAGELNAADNNPANQVYTTDQTITDFLNDTGADLARTCLPIWGSGTVSITTSPQFVPFSALTTGSGQLWALEGRGVTLGGTPLVRAARHFVDGNSGTLTPFNHWYPNGQQGITVVTNPALTGTLTATGLLLPPLLAEDGDTADWLPSPDCAVVLCEGAAARLCEKNAANAILGAQITYHWDRYNAGKQARQAQLSDNEKALMVAFGDGEGGS